jgi:hypothetical protein
MVKIKMYIEIQNGKSQGKTIRQLARNLSHRQEVSHGTKKRQRSILARELQSVLVDISSGGYIEQFLENSC